MMSKLDSGVLTQRQYGEIAFQYLIENLLDVKMDGHIALSLMEYNSTNKVDIRDVLNMSEADIDDLTYNIPQQDEEQDDKGKVDTKPSVPTYKQYLLPKGSKRLLKVVLAYNDYRTLLEDPIMDDWSNVSPTEFNAFRMRDYQIFIKTPIPARFKTPESPSTNKPSNYSSYTKAEIFKKGIKRDPSLFRVFKDKKQFKSWHRHLLTTSGTQEVKKVLDPRYIYHKYKKILIYSNSNRNICIILLTIFYRLIVE